MNSTRTSASLSILIPSLLLCFVTSLIPSNACAQVATGTPPFGSFSGGPDVINNANLNAHWTIPVLHKPGRGTNFTYDLNYDSSVWYPSGTTWQPAYNWGWRGVTEVITGYITYSTSTHRCLVENNYENYYIYGSWSYHDAFGVRHNFNISVSSGNADCGIDSTQQTGTATDGSGYSLTADGGGGPGTTLYSSTGTLINAPLRVPAGGGFTDRNGNEINTDSSGHFYDTLSSTTAALTVSGTAPSNTTFSYTPPSGTGSVTYTMSYVNYTVATNFAISGIIEYGAHAIYLVDKITLPDGTFYQFMYEQTPGTPTSGACSPLSGTYQNYCVTARPVKVTLPAGGYVSYTYSGGAGTNNSGIFSDGSAATVQRTLNDGSHSNAWTYARTAGTGSAYATRVSDPLSNDTIIQFQGIYETQRDAYNGAGPAFTSVPISESTLQTSSLLGETQTCYNAATAPCTGTAVSSSITQRDVLTSTPSAGSVTLQSKQTTKYNSVGGPIESDEYAFGSGSFGALLRQTLITYAPLGNITAFRQTVTVKNGGGTVLAQTNYNYDQTTPVNPPAIPPQWISVGGSRGNLTSIQRCTNLTSCSTYLQTTLTYDTAGQVQTVQDPLLNQTSFSYSDNFFADNGSNPAATYTPSVPTDAFVTKVTLPTTNTTKYGYYYYSSQAAQAVDQNGNTSYTHFDSIGRPSSTYGPTLPIAGTQSTANPWTLINYTSATQIDTYVDINDSSTTATSTCSICRHDRVVLDGLGRSINAYLMSDPEGQTEVDTAYDNLGRVKTASHPYRSTSDGTYGIETPTYDALSRTTKITHQDTTYSLAAFGASVTGSNVNTAQLCSSSTFGLGYPSLFTDESGRQREVWTDAFGRTIEADEPDSNGSLKNSYVCYSYDPLGNLLSVVHSSTPSQTRSYVYDVLSRVTSVTIPELANSSGANCAVTYTYDGNSNVQTRTAPAPNQNASCTTGQVTTTYTYDTLNRVTKIQYSDGTTPTVQYAYDGGTLSGCAVAPPSLTDSNKLGTRTAMCDGSGATSWAHDALGRTVTEKRTLISSPSNLTQTLSYSYNLDSSIYSITYPSGKIVNYTVSNAQRLLTAKDVANNIQFATAASYAATGQFGGMITGQVNGGFAGINECHSYNSSLEYSSAKATSNTCSSTGTTMDLALQYNLNPPNGGQDNGTVTKITNNADNGRTQTLTYDPLNRILSAQSANTTTGNPDCWGQVFGPDGTVADDAVANLAKINSGTQTQPTCPYGSLSVTVDANNHFTGTNLAYDAAGNMTQDGTSGVTYTFDAENRLIKTTGVTNGPYCYVYDGKGLRVAKKSNANTTCTTGTYAKLYWRSLSGDALAETDNAGNTQNEYVFFAGRRIASRDGSGHIFYYFADQLGSTRTITIGSGPGQTPGQLCYDQDYTPYGQEVFTTANMTRLQTTACPPNYKFTGYERDSETGLDYAFARYYSSRLGRFLSTDPLGGSIGNLQSHNAYAYVANNPMNLTDPSGMHCLGGQVAGWNRACPDSDNPYPSGGGGGSGLDGNCYLNGAPAACSLVTSLLASPGGSTVQCPNNLCSIASYTSVSVNGEFVTGYTQVWQFLAFAGGNQYYAMSGPGALYYSADQAGAAAGAYFLPYTEATHREFGGAVNQDANGFFSYSQTDVGAECESIYVNCAVSFSVGDAGGWHTHVFEGNVSQFFGDRTSVSPFTDYVTTPVGSTFDTVRIDPWPGGIVGPYGSKPLEMMDYPQIAPICNVSGPGFPQVRPCH